MITELEAIWLSIWSYKLSLVPVALTYLLFDLPALIRRVTGIAYVPIYFLIYPVGHSDRLYAEYFSEDDFYGIGAEMSPKQKADLRRRIQVTAVFSMLFAAVVAPWVCGFVAAFYLTGSQFTEFLWVLFIVKPLLILRALRHLRSDSRAVLHGNAFLYVVILYVLYLIVVFLGLTNAFRWTVENLDSLAPIEVALRVLENGYREVFLNVIVVALATWAATARFTDPRNISPPERWDEIGPYDDEE
jgi:hypothetical protein